MLHVILLRDVVNTQLQGRGEITVRSLGQAIYMERCTTSCFGAGPVVATLRVGVRGTTDPETILQTVDAAAGLLPPADRRRRFALMVNPTSGSRSALKRLRDTVEPVLAAAGVEYTVFETSARGDGRRFAASLNEITGYAGIIIMGGDGTCTEVPPPFLPSLPPPFPSPAVFSACRHSQQSATTEPKTVLIAYDYTGYDAAACMTPTILPTFTATSLSTPQVHSGNMENLRLPLAILPVGSDNSMAYTLGMRNLAEGLLAIVKGPCIPIDTS